MSDKGDAYKYLDNKCTEIGYESLGDFIGCQITDTIATCMVAWFAEKQANGANASDSGLHLQRVRQCALDWWHKLTPQVGKYLCDKYYKTPKRHLTKLTDREIQNIWQQEHVA